MVALHAAAVDVGRLAGLAMATNLMEMVIVIGCLSVIGIQSASQSREVQRWDW